MTEKTADAGVTQALDAIRDSDRYNLRAEPVTLERVLDTLLRIEGMLMAQVHAQNVIVGRVKRIEDERSLAAWGR